MKTILLSRPIVLLMTATIAPKGVFDAKFSVAERWQQYLAAFKFYLRHLKPGRTYDYILFCENSDTDLSPLEALVPPELSERVGFVSAPSRLPPPKLRKGNEFGLMDYACDHSPLLLPEGRVFFKVTGRFATLNIDTLLREVRKCDEALELFCDQKDHRLYSRLGLDWCQQDGEM